MSHFQVLLVNAEKCLTSYRAAGILRLLQGKLREEAVFSGSRIRKE
jgi:hypothetical protein